jgi:hypothetical protein
MELNNNNMEVSHLFPKPLARFRAPNDVIAASMNIINSAIDGDPQVVYDYLHKCAQQYATDVLGLEKVTVTDMQRVTIDVDTKLLTGNGIAFGVFAVHVPHNICRIQYNNPDAISFADSTVHRYNDAHLFISKNELLIFTSAPKIIPPKNEEDSVFITFKIKYYVD